MQNTKQKLNIPKGWKETTLGEVAEIITGKTPPTSVSELFGTNYPFITPTDIDNESIFCDSERGLSRAGAKYQKNLLLPKNAICYTCIASIGKICITKKESFTNQQINSLMVNNKNDWKYIYYLLRYNTPQMLRIAGGTTTGIINKTQFSNFEIILPPLPEQRAIAAVLSSLDDKIELLREQNKTLEATAQAIFKEWFATPSEALAKGGELPKGWKSGNLTDIANYLNGLALQKFPPESPINFLPVIKIKEMKTGITSQTGKASKNLEPKYIVMDGDILFSWSGSLEIVIWKHGKGALNQHLFKITSEKYPKWFYYYWTLYHLPYFKQIASAKAVTMGHIQRHHLESALVLIPDNKFLEKADKVMAPIFEKILNNSSQIQTLSKFRDTLLPKLMRGELSVNK